MGYTKYVYRASDGKEFDSKASAEAHEYYLAGLKLEKQGNYDGAIAAYNNGLAHDKRYSIYAARGFAFLNKGEYDKAIADYNASLYPLEDEEARKYNTPNSNDCIYLYNRGITYSRKGETDKAIADYKKAADWGSRIDMFGKPENESVVKDALKNLASMGVQYTPVPFKRGSSSGSSYASGGGERKKNKLGLVIVIIIVGLLVLFNAPLIIGSLSSLNSSSSAAANAATVTVTADSLNLRAQASGSAEIIKALNQGSVLTVTGDAVNGWLPVEHEGAKGWVWAEYVE